jgi:ectoine hydroxylase-related dioxygenase (phytanoyl-CoA dioxygenase family)
MARDLTSHHQQLVDDGYTIVENAIEPGLIDALLSDVRRLESELDRRPADNRFEGNRTTRTYNLLAHGAIWQQVPVHPVVLELVEGVLGPQCLVSSLASISLAPGETGQVLHADDQIQPLAKPHVATVCNSMWALTDFTAGNGATRVVPGSHLWDSPDYFNGEPDVDTVVAEMPKGSVLVWHGSTWHGGGANTTTDEVRVGVAMNYCAGFIRQQENQQLGIPSEVMATFSPQLRQLCGLGMYRGLTGNIEKRSPAEILYGDPPQVQVWDAEPIDPRH